MLEKEIPATDTIIHLACISNDPSYEVNPNLGKSINCDAFVSLVDIASMVQSVIGPDISVKTVPADDNRSYHVSSKKIKEKLGFASKHTIEEAVFDLKKAFEEGKIPDPMNNIRYYNIKTMQALNLN